MRLPLLILSAGLVLLTATASAPAQTLTRVTNTTVTGIPNGISISGTKAYVSDFGGGTLQVYSIANPLAPVLLGSCSAIRPRALAAADTMAYILGFGLGQVTTSYLTALYVSNPATPAAGRVVLFGEPPIYIGASRSLVCAASTIGGTVRVFDSLLNQLSSFTASATAVVLNGTALYLNFYGTTTVYDLSNPAAPVRVRVVNGPINVVNGNRACGLYGSLYSYDVSSPLNPVLLGTASLASGYGLLAMTGTTAYTCESYSGMGSNNLPMKAFAISQASAPVLQATTAASASATAIAASGNYVFLVNQFGSLFQVYALSGTGTGTRSSQQNTMGIYPNPAHAALTMTPPNPAAPVEVYDLAGRVCLTARVSAGIPLDISHLPAGMYVVRNGSVTQPLVVE
ncbi:T9SS type A sorting domain-containing protein [Microvirga sp. STS02]|uniref:T9SS type A sorting domain-containing protein n=1 Tax=Hymenobacter negativus TaxID=2795026 RepID=UPI0018DC52E6|nr:MULTISPECIES: T9SS type A sorting domain-containing protein [Bacteria]MBH8569836.1 T9SS type A sorting domain-containing protein [Hymenobacter negativus]MBR7209575.1 T9SS type A sorting domain-containing protein [Microvirga sp. STS02]